jgi:hypothetical protein
MSKIKLVAVQRFFDRIDNYIHLVIGEKFYDLIAFSDSPPSIR